MKKQSKYDLIIFDIDGTLIDASLGMKKAYDIALSDLGWNNFSTDINLIRKGCGLVRNDYIRFNFPGISDKEIEILATKVSDHLINQINNSGINFYPDHKEVITELKKFCKIGIVSNCGKTYLENFLKESEISGIIDMAICYGTFNENKSYNIKYVIEELESTKALYVGDTEGDQSSSIKAGAEFCWARYGYGENVSSSLFIDDLTELTKLVIQD